MVTQKITTILPAIDLLNGFKTVLFNFNFFDKYLLLLNSEGLNKFYAITKIKKNQVQKKSQIECKSQN